MTIKPKNILLVKNRALGDAVISIAAGRYLRSEFPSAKITFATPTWTCPVFLTIEHPFDSILPLQIKTPSDVIDLWSELLNSRFDLIYEMHFGPRTGRILSLFSKLRKVPYFYLDHQKSERASIIDRDISGISKSLKLSKQWGDFVTNVKKSTIKKIVLGVVATRESKMWPLGNFVALVELLKRRDPLCEIIIPISTSVADQKIRKSLLQMGISHRVLFFEETLDSVSDLFKTVDLYIGNDTGLKHIAIFSGVRTISFFGPEDPLEWHPYDRTDHPYFFLPDLECRYKTSHYCGLDQCDTMDCLTAFTPDQVVKLINSFGTDVL